MIENKAKRLDIVNNKTLVNNKTRKPDRVVSKSLDIFIKNTTKNVIIIIKKGKALTN